MSSKYYGKPRLVEPWSPKRKGPNEVCQKTLYENEQRFLCYAPTIDGKQYCETCFIKTLTGEDRKPPEQPAPKPYAWSNDQLIPRKRA